MLRVMCMLMKMKLDFSGKRIDELIYLELPERALNAVDLLIFEFLVQLR